MRWFALSLVVVAACAEISGLSGFDVGDGVPPAGAGGDGGDGGVSNVGGSMSQGVGGDGLGGSGGGMQGGGGSGGEPDPGHAIPAADVEPQIDGICDEAIWNSATPFPFTGEKTSNNDIDCRLLWRDRPAPDPDLLYGCCHVDDTNLNGSASGHDVDGIYDDDSIEVIVDRNSDDEADSQTVKVFFGANDATWDGVFSNGVQSFDETHTAGIDRSIDYDSDFDGDSDDDYWLVEWVFELPFDVQPGQIGKCQLALNDDDGRGRTVWIASGDLGEINDPSAWGHCQFTPATN